MTAEPSDVAPPIETPILSHSGARFIFTDSSVTKLGDERIYAQGWYCREHPGYCPHVTDLSADPLKKEWSYSMERLFPLEGKLPLKQIVERARTGFWNRVAYFEYNWKDRLVDWAGENGFWWIRKLVPYLQPRLEAPCEIHGDLTLANIMKRANGDLVLIDPIPPGGKIPPYRCVDYAKLMQSAYGWEGVLKTGQGVTNKDMIKDIIKLSLDDGVTMDTVMAWTIVHLTRILPYTQAGTKVHNWTTNRIKAARDAFGS